MGQHPSTGTVGPWWADIRGISELLWWNRQEQWEAVHTQLCVCVFHNAPASGPVFGFGSNPEPPFPPTDLTVQGALGLQTAGTLNFLEQHESFQRNMILPQGLLEYILRPDISYLLKCCFPRLHLFVTSKAAQTHLSNSFARHQRKISSTNLFPITFKACVMNNESV